MIVREESAAAVAAAYTAAKEMVGSM